ncbi:MAG: DNA repair protein RecN [Christensenellales bacterium]|jgi:DNA repair protein RecN (Recombination protein N)
MLQHLSVHNIAIISKLEVDFAPGLNVLTGETGAGKSIIIDAMNLVLGERADRSLIKYSEEAATVEAVFDYSGRVMDEILLENGIVPEQDALILFRQLNSQGKSVCRVNGRIVPLSTLKQISDLLVDVHGQHEHQSLLNPKTHGRFIDRYAHQEVLPHKRQVGELYRRFRQVEQEIRAGLALEDREERLALLNRQSEELDEAELAEGEEEALLQELALLSNSEKVAKALDESFALLYAGGQTRPILDCVADARSALAGIADFSQEYQALFKRLEETYFNLEDIALELRNQKNGLEFSPGRMQQIEERLSLLHRLQKKYGHDISGLLVYREQIQEEIFSLENSRERMQELQAQHEALCMELYEASEALSAARKEAAQRFCSGILAQLHDLGLSKSVFEVEFAPLPSMEDAAFTANGLDRMEFMLSTNPGQPPKPLSKVVSGGEMSRVMLAFKYMTAGLDDIPCMIFDEIDTGISGKIGGMVARKLAHIGRQRQVICVSHLPQIASMADRHFAIVKTIQGQETSTELVLLDEEGRKDEIARMFGGQSELSLSHASEMIRDAQRMKGEL